MPPVALQIKSNAVGLPDNGLACYGMMVSTYDTTSIHHRVDCVVKAFDKPSGASTNVSASVVLRSVTPVAGNGLTGYTLSWGRNDDNTNIISCYRWAGGVQTQVGSTITTNIPAPVVGDTFSGSISGSTLTAYINNAQVASFTDTTITTGTFAGVHFYRSDTASNCYWDSFATFTVPPPVTPPPTGSRDVLVWPGSVNSPFNTPIGSGATFDTHQPISGGYVKVDVYSVAFDYSAVNPVLGVTYPPETMNNSGEGHVEQFQSDRHTSLSWYRFYATSGTTGFANRNNSIVDMKGDLTRTNLTPGPVGSFHQQRASRIWNGAGIIRKWDMSQGVIRHALCLIGSQNVLNTTFVAPANATDGAAGGNTGPWPMGGLIAIPSSTAMPAGLSAPGKMIWQAFHDYGGYFTDGFANTAGTCAIEAEFGSTGHASAAEVNTILQQCRLVTNNSTTFTGQWGGPGTRRTSLAPAV